MRFPEIGRIVPEIGEPRLRESSSDDMPKKRRKAS